jgi:DNA recombination-dependent growth factor C
MTLLARNATFLTFNCATKEQFESSLNNRKFTPLTGLDSRRAGFVPPMSGDDRLIRFAGDVGAFAMRIDANYGETCLPERNRAQRLLQRPPL